MESPPIPLEIRGLTRRYGSLIAVDALDLEVRRGEILGFLGPNGAGKTTTLRCSSGLLRPHAGVIRVAGFDLEQEPRRARAAMGFVPDRPFLYPRLTAREFLDLVGALYDVPAPRARERADEILTRLDLGAERDDLIETYSLGMRQKVAVAAAVLHDPPLLLLDEPLGGLDPQSARALKDLLRERAAAGHGVLVSTHLLDVAERLCDRVAIVSHGRLRASGTLDELRRESGATTLEDVFLERVKEPEPR
jgi:ABC-2 type transport system ATP-binding protein